MFSAPHPKADIPRQAVNVRFVPVSDGPLSIKTLNVGARQSSIASGSGSDTDRVYFVRHSAVRAFTLVHHYRGYRLAYAANP
jgi:hypothetical protein